MLKWSSFSFTYISFSNSVVTMKGFLSFFLVSKKNILDFSKYLNIVTEVLLHSAGTETVSEHNANVPNQCTVANNITTKVYYQHLTCFSVSECSVYTVYFSTVKCRLLQRKNNNQLHFNHERSFLVVHARSIDQVIFVRRNESHY